MKVNNKEQLESIIKMNNFIISASRGFLRVWDETTYKCTLVYGFFFCPTGTAFSQLNDDTVVSGGREMLFFGIIKASNIEDSDVKKFRDKLFGGIYCLYVNGDGLIFTGSVKGRIVCFDPSYNKIIFKSESHDGFVYCLIEDEEHKLISCSEDEVINIYN